MSIPQGLTLFVVDTESDADPVLVESGAPLYYSWGGADGSLLVNIGGQVKLFQQLPLDSSSLPLSTGRGFRVPAFSGNGTELAYTNLADGAEALLVAPVSSPNDGVPVLDVGPFSAFMWSPDGTQLAVADQDEANSLAFERLRVVSADGKQVRTITSESLLAFYWSPDGNRIAWVGLAPGGEIVRVDSGCCGAGRGGRDALAVPVPPLAKRFYHAEFL